MDIEKSIEFLLQAQAKTEAALAQLAQTNKLEQQQLTQQQQQLAQQQVQLAESLSRLVDVVADIAASQRQNEETLQRFQEENRLAHQRYDAAHRETDQRFNALIKMMDEWIRERGKRNGSS